MEIDQTPTPQAGNGAQDSDYAYDRSPQGQRHRVVVELEQLASIAQMTADAMMGSASLDAIHAVELVANRLEALSNDVAGIVMPAAQAADGAA